MLRTVLSRTSVALVVTALFACAAPVGLGAYFVVLPRWGKPELPTLPSSTDAERAATRTVTLMRVSRVVDGEEPVAKRRITPSEVPAKRATLALRLPRDDRFDRVDRFTVANRYDLIGPTWRDLFLLEPPMKASAPGARDGALTPLALRLWPGPSNVAGEPTLIP